MRNLQLTLILFCGSCLFAPSLSPAQQSPQYDEVIFGFTLKNLGSYNISVAVKGDRIYLPVMELFNIFEVYYTIEGQNIIKGTYLTSAFPMTIDPVKRVITLGDKRYELTREEILKGSIDIYLSTEKFEEIFGIISTVNFNRLQINAETTKELPALIRKRTALERSEMGGGPSVSTKYPLRYDIQRSFLGGAVMNYNITTSLNGFLSQGTSYTFTGGGEVAEGDVHGNLIGGTGQAATLSDTRWRYVVRDNEYFSSFSAGQITTGSDFIPRVTGIALSNEPVEPRVMFDNYVVDGYTDPESEVELYLNDRLIGFQKTNAAGYYRFQIPLTYGTARITIRTFSKYGDINVNQKQIQIPFTFVPEGILSYNVQAGKVDQNVVPTNNAFFGNANLLYGATNWLTLKGGLQKSSNSGLQNPIYDLGFSSRLFSQYIADVDVAPNAYYSIDASALFASNAGFSVQYTKYVLTDTLIGTSPQQNGSLAVYVPFTFISSGTSIRLSENYSNAASTQRWTPRIDFATLLTGIQLLLSYQETMTGSDIQPLNLAGNGLLTTTAMYSLPRGSGLPDFLQGFLLRGQAIYDLQAKLFQDGNLQLSKTFLQIFQFNLGIDRDFATKSTSIQAGLIMDLDVTRTSSVLNASQGSVTQRHSLYGAVGLDQNTSRPFLSNREEVDKGGIDVVLFVDNNNDSVYDAGDELIPAKGVKVDGMGKIEVGRDSVIRVSQLQSYFRYNLEVDRQQIDPNLVPLVDKFSFVVDPNQIRRIEIPFYRGGTIAGTAYLEKKGLRTALSGARIIMQSTTGPTGDTLRTFADGGFYVMNVAPGSYALTVDSAQLQYLGVAQLGGPLVVTVHHSRQGDIIDTLEIVVGKSEPKLNLKSGNDTETLTSADNATEMEQPVEKKSADNLEQAAQKQKADSLEQSKEAVTVAPVARPMAETIKTASTEPASKTEIAPAKYEDAFGVLKSKKYEEAAAAFQRLLDAKVPDDVADHCHYWIGEIKYASKQYAEALREFNAVLTFDTWKKKGDAQFMIAQCYQRMNKRTKAREAFARLIRDYPTNDNVKKAKEALRSKVTTTQATGETNNAISPEEAAKVAIATVKYEDAVGAVKSSKYAEAAAALRKLLDEKVPDDIADHCHYWIGEIKYASKQYKEALQEFNAVLTFDTWKKRGDAQFMIGLCYKKMGEREKAREAFERVVKDYPMTGNIKKAKEALAKIGG